jgi:hypothetical protein
MTAGRVAGAKLWTTGLALFAALAAQRVQAQLQITEIMGNPIGVNDDVWEWIEVRNTGATDVDLNGYFIDRLGDPRIPSGSATPSIMVGQSTNTIVPAGGTAVIYDGDIAINAGDYNDAFFRQAWGLTESTPLIAAAFNFGGGLSNSGNTSLGFWPTFSAYEMDLADDGEGTFRVANFNNAALSLDFRTAEPSSFPAYDNGVSIRWNGTGDWKSGANWGSTTTGTTSVAVTIPGATNSIQDVASPGVTPSTLGAPASLIVTEIMYNPRSPEPGWEWVEVYNGGPTINFGTTPYVLHDLTQTTDLAAANVTTGILPTGGVAIFYDGSISQADMTSAWDPGGTRGTLFIPVASFPPLNQTGDTVVLWDSLADYQTDSADPSPRRIANAAMVQPYNDEAGTFEGTTGTWPTDNGDGSIRLFDLSLDAAGRVEGTNWDLSNSLDGVSFNAAAVNGTITVHPGGDLGTPGVFSSAPTGNGANFDGLGVVDGADLAIWKANFGTGTTQATGDADGDGDVDGRDFLVWQRQVGTTPAAAAASAVPEPAGCVIALVSVAALAGLRRRS